MNFFKPTPIFPTLAGLGFVFMSNMFMGCNSREGLLTTHPNPTVSSVSPVDSATNIPLNSKIVVMFSDVMDSTTIDSIAFTLKRGTSKVAGTIRTEGNTATFTPSTNLIPNTKYVAKILSGIQNQYGGSMDSSLEWHFTTGVLINPTPPVVALISPISGAVNTPINQTLEVIFSTNMDSATVTQANFYLTTGNTIVAGIVKLEGTKATFTPLVPLIPNTLYTAKVSVDVADVNGVHLATDYLWSFSTSPSIAILLDHVAPYGSFGGSAGFTNQGVFTLIKGDVGTTAACSDVTGVHDNTGTIFTETTLNNGYVDGEVQCAPPAPGTSTKFAEAEKGLLAARTAYSYFSNLSGGSDPGAGELGDLTLAPGTYTSESGTFKITKGDLTLDAQGDTNAQWVFQMASALTVGLEAQPRSIILANGALAKNIIWVVGSAATINGAGGGAMAGTILANAGVSFSTAGNVEVTSLNGRAISLNASVTLVNTVITVP